MKIGEIYKHDHSEMTILVTQTCINYSINTFNGIVLIGNEYHRFSHFNKDWYKPPYKRIDEDR